MLKVLVEGCEPTKGSKYSAAVDLYASEDVVIGAGETIKVPLGVCIDIGGVALKLADIGKDNSTDLIEKLNEFKSNHYLQLEPRSSLRAKGLIAGTGIIDLDYKDEIKIIIHNPVSDVESFNDSISDFQELLGANGDYHYKINKGDKIAQILLKEHKTYLMGISTEDKRVGGFGSTGSK